ncbi:hypothetical protein HMN09_01206000 [Mycena chlorophos]|uniref:MYND-type domain-containing protein n=1 Tax=Mycena chlorophos TaxID=658473 RepID=A0A8H6S6M0_MYCCL|nr:hypothetical protein HMN09_01206000 [Mycena chlorophos]
MSASAATKPTARYELGTLPRVCTVCKKPETAEKRMMKCSQCRIMEYCSVECQKIAWKEHKLRCKKDDSELSLSQLGQALFKNRTLNILLQFALVAAFDLTSIPSFRLANEAFTADVDILIEPAKDRDFLVLLDSPHPDRAWRWPSGSLNARCLSIFARYSGSPGDIDSDPGTIAVVRLHKAHSVASGGESFELAIQGSVLGAARESIASGHDDMRSVKFCLSELNRALREDAISTGPNKFGLRTRLSARDREVFELCGDEKLDAILEAASGVQVESDHYGPALLEFRAEEIIENSSEEELKNLGLSGVSLS